MSLKSEDFRVFSPPISRLDRDYAEDPKTRLSPIYR